MMKEKQGDETCPPEMEHKRMWQGEEVGTTPLVERAPYAIFVLFYLFFFFFFELLFLHWLSLFDILCQDLVLSQVEPLVALPPLPALCQGLKRTGIELVASVFVVCLKLKKFFSFFFNSHLCYFHLSMFFFLYSLNRFPPSSSVDSHRRQWQLP